MKFRTDFVTNSSDTSYLAFNIKNKKLWEYLTNLGIKFDSCNEGEFSDSTKITLPSGLKGMIQDEEGPGSGYASYKFKSVSEWLIHVFLNDFTYIEGCEDGIDEDDYDDDKPLEMWEAFTSELSQIISPDKKRCIAGMDGDIEYAHIEYQEGAETEMNICEEINIHDGIRTVKTPEEEFLGGLILGEDVDFDGTPGQVISQKWTDGRWVTVSK